MYQSAIRDLHRALLTHIGTSQYDLISQTRATIACRMPSPARTHLNPLTADFLRTGPHEHLAPGSTAFRSHLEGKLTKLLQGHSSVTTAQMIERVIQHPDSAIQTEFPDQEQHLLLALREDETWALWQSCCLTSTWYVKRAPPNDHHSTIGTVAVPNGLATNGTAYFPPQTMMMCSIYTTSSALACPRASVNTGWRIKFRDTHPRGID
jgi:hypothetical protein